MPQQEASGAAVDLISRVQRGPLERWLCRNMQLEELMSLLEQATVALPQAQPRSRQPRSDVDGVSEQHQHIQKRGSKLNQATLNHLANVWSISVVEGTIKYYDSLESALIATTDFPVPGPPLTITTCFLPRKPSCDALTMVSNTVF